MLAHCSPSSKWVPSGNTGEIKAERKGTGQPTSHADGLGEASSLTGTPLCTKVYGTTFTFVFLGGRVDQEINYVEIFKALQLFALDCTFPTLLLRKLLSM